MLPDITQYYAENNKQQYKIKNNYIGTCNFELCGLPILEGNEVMYNNEIYCCKYHVNEQILYEKECE